MEHTNLLYYATRAELITDYPDGKVDNPVPGVAYAKDEKSILFNKKKVSYEVTVLYEDRSGNTLASSTTVNTPEALEGSVTKVVIYPVEVEDAKPISQTQKIRVSADTEFTFLYYVLTSYTITVNHMFSGTAIASATTIEVEDVFEEDVVSVTIEPEEIEGYTASPVTIMVSGDCEYDLEYEERNICYVDLGLPSGTLWACSNLGASSPEQYGDHYAWGEIVPNKATAYTWDNYRFGGDPDNSVECSKYNSTDGKEELDLEDDAANVVMGGEWHIPHPLQWIELLDYTTSAWTTLNGVAGMQLTSNENGNTIFFPAAGVVIDAGLVVQGDIFVGCSSCTYGNSNPWNTYIFVGRSDGFNLSEEGRCYGFSVRGVLGEITPGPKELETA